ncbi:LAETG motif-containing sortase-dependent surface protein [Streptomyces sp. ID05-39B]|uniref:LAETG motif-containing sortase-dependent surface protein n=1 Tax=Streptomyces sp. ID05-39B TaxID=3028664 RepID=UPI0029A2A2E8|nr:LAETG motif-containing sortase-dependent surface protein [Streptomyces sp. ID05-39B]MDX3530902.1 LAETG motif-containing sortase-dependent surface protein [Streptomyces sp. ID05-39B]
MSPSRRTAASSVRIVGLVGASAALVLGASGTALATDPLGIGQFSAAASCDGSKGVITVTDTDATATPAVVTVFLQNNNADLKRIGAPTPVKGSAEGIAVTFTENWAPGAKYRIHIKSGNDLDADIPILEAPAKACTGADDTPTTPSTPTTPATTPSDTASSPAGSKSPGQSASQSDSTVPAASASNAPSPAAQESNLAETGASSRTGLIAGIAAALVAVGGGAVFFGMRRKGTGNR